jgi:WD40 repeat protein
MDKTVRAWDATSGVELCWLRGHEGVVESVAISPDGRQIVSGDNDNTVRVWDTISGVELHCLRGHEKSVWSVTFSPDGRQVVSGSADNTVRVWDVISGAQLRCLEGHEVEVNRVAMSPDGRQIVSGAHDNSVRVWDATSGDCLQVIPRTEDVPGDVRALAAGAARFPWRAVQRGIETVVESSQGGIPVAWLPAQGSTTALSSGRAWVMTVERYLCLFVLEGA